MSQERPTPFDVVRAPYGRYQPVILQLKGKSSYRFLLMFFYKKSLESCKSHRVSRYSDIVCYLALNPPPLQCGTQQYSHRVRFVYTNWGFHNKTYFVDTYPMTIWVPPSSPLWRRFLGGKDMTWRGRYTCAQVLHTSGTPRRREGRRDMTP